MNTNLKASERMAVLDAVSPVSQAPGTITTGWVPTAAFHSISALICTGVLGTSATVDAKLRQATDASGTGAKDIAGKALTQIVKASGDNKQAMIEVRGEELDGNNGFGYVQLSLTVGAAASQVSALLLGTNPRFLPASTRNAASVVQVV